MNSMESTADLLGLPIGTDNSDVSDKSLSLEGYNEIITNESESEGYFSAESEKLLNESDSEGLIIKMAMRNDEATYGTESDNESPEKVNKVKKFLNAIIAAFKKIGEAIVNAIKRIGIVARGPIVKKQSDYFGTINNTEKKNEIQKKMSDASVKGPAPKQTISSLIKEIDNSITRIGDIISKFTAYAENPEKHGLLQKGKEIVKSVAEVLSGVEAKMKSDIDSITEVMALNTGVTAKGNGFPPASKVIHAYLYGADADKAQINGAKFFQHLGVPTCIEQLSPETAKQAKDFDKTSRKAIKSNRKAKNAGEKSLKNAEKEGSGNLNKIRVSQKILADTRDIHSYQVSLVTNAVSAFINYRSGIANACKKCAG